MPTNDPLLELGITFYDAVIVRVLRRERRNLRAEAVARQTIARLQREYPHISIPALINGRCSHDNASE